MYHVWRDMEGGCRGSSAGWLSLKDEGRRTSLHLVRLDYLPLSRRGNRER